MGKGRTIAGVIYENYLKVSFFTLNFSLKDHVDYFIEGPQAGYLGVSEQ